MEIKECSNVIAPSAFIHKTARMEAPVHLARGVEIHANNFLGRYSFINCNSVVYPNVSIGRYCSIGRNSEIGVALHPTDFLSTHLFQFESTLFPNCKDYCALKHVKKQKWLHLPTSIGSDVWIGAKAIIMPDLVIGNGAIIASGAVVTKNVPAYEIWGGVPAKLIKKRFSDKIIEDLLELKWWELDISLLNGVDFSNIEIAINNIKLIKTKLMSE